MFFVSQFPVFLFLLWLLAIACGCCCGGAYRGGGRHPDLQPSTGWEKTTWPPPTWSGWKELRITLCLTVLLKTDTKVIWSTPKSVSQLHFQWSSLRCVSFPNWAKVVSTNCRAQHKEPYLDIESSKTSWKWIPYQFRSTNVALQQKHHFDAIHAVVSWWRTILTLQAETFVVSLSLTVQPTINGYEPKIMNYTNFAKSRTPWTFCISGVFFGHKCGGKLNFDRILIDTYS